MTHADGQHPAQEGLRSTLIGAGVNGTLALGKGVAGYMGNSYALIADAIESTSDIFSSLIVYFGLRIAARPPDANHPYGHGKAEPLAALVVSAALLGAAAVIVHESIREIRVPHHAPAPFTLAVLAAVVLFKETLFRYVMGVGERVESTVVKTDAWHHRSDAITSALAFVGISIALIGGKGYESADDWAALGAAAVIAYNGFRLIRGAMYELTDVAPPPEISREVRRVAQSVDGVVEVEKLLVRKMGFDYYVDLHVVVDRNLPVYEGHRIAHEVKDAIRAELPRIAEVLTHVEPTDNFRR
jgi:cation diffusion facilitator family transporter